MAVRYQVKMQSRSNFHQKWRKHASRANRSPDGRYNMITVNPRLCYITSPNACQSSMAEEVSQSLAGRVRFIHPKFLYDERGSDLFEQISSVPEYYLTRTEMQILGSKGPGLSCLLTGDYALVELGSGAAKKTRLLLDLFEQRQETVEYFPIDISSVIKESSARLQMDYAKLRITGILDQYENGLRFIRKIEQKKIIAFLGSSLGNFDYRGAIGLLKEIRSSMSRGDLFLLGLDLVKDREVLERAYNDRAGVTARFNLNLLSRINSELGGNFNLENFEHVAFYNPRHASIEMHLRSRRSQKISISAINLDFRMERDETILTEYSYKFTPKRIEQMAEKTGFGIENFWYDKKKYFALVLFSA